jgi:hypothetical protein
MKENDLLRYIAQKAQVSIEFKDENILPGTAWIDGLPIDIEIINDKIILNSVGSFSGDEKSYRKAEFRGKGKFRNLCSHIRDSLRENGFEPALYLTPLSPVWIERYNLVATEVPIKGNNFKIIL